MKRIFLSKILLICLIVQFVFVLSCFAQEVKQKEVKAQELAVYFDKDYIDNHYFASQRIGDGLSLEIDDNWKDNPQSGQTCIRIKYNATGPFGFAGVYWVNPKENWGNLKGGYDLRFAKKLTFWVRGDVGSEHIAVFKFGGLKGVYSDSDNHGIGPIVLTDKWQQFSVDLKGRDMRRISAGFSFAISKAYNRKGCIFYIDNIKYE